jgi:Protein of unknown function (DUF2934)
MTISCQGVPSAMRPTGLGCGMKRNQSHLQDPTVPTVPGIPEPAESEIQKEAYFLWLEKGRPPGLDLEIWHEAKELLRHRRGHPEIPVTPSLPGRGRRPA